MATTLTFFPVSGDYQAVDDVEPQSNVSTPDVEVVSGLVKFTARLPQGFSAYVPDYQVSTDTNNKQTITMIGSITGGNWALAFYGLWTTLIAAGASAAAVQAALEALPNVGAGNCTVAGPVNGPYEAEFVGALANMPHPQMLTDDSGLVASSGSAHVSVVMLQGGSVSRVAPTSISIPVRNGRIWTSGQLCSINHADSPNVELLPNLPALGLTFDLIYDVSFTAVRYNGLPQNIAPFAFTAPVDSTPVCITDPALVRLKYVPPIHEMWYPGWVPPVYTTTARFNVSRGVTDIHDWRKAG